MYIELYVVQQCTIIKRTCKISLNKDRPVVRCNERKRLEGICIGLPKKGPYAVSLVHLVIKVLSRLAVEWKQNTFDFHVPTLIRNFN